MIMKKIEDAFNEWYNKNKDNKYVKQYEPIILGVLSFCGIVKDIINPPSNLSSFLKMPYLALLFIFGLF